jgi:UDP-glucose 4-epimerase
MTSRPSCIVLGGGGFLGINLCRRLVASGFRVRAFGRRCLFPESLGGAEWYQGDFSDGAALANALESFDTVFHLVHTTTPQSANLDIASDLESNVAATLTMLEHCRKLGMKRVVFVSSGGIVYGAPAVVPTPETAPTDPISAYGISKLAIEKYLELYRHLHGLDYRILRVSNPFGPFQVPHKNQGIVASLISRGLKGERVEIWGDGSVVRDFLYVDDVVDALLAAAEDRSAERIFNIGGGRGRSVREVIAAIENLLNLRLEIDWRRGRPVDIPVSTLAIERARDCLGWAPRTSFEEGLAKTIAWWQSELHHGT